MDGHQFTDEFRRQTACISAALVLMSGTLLCAQATQPAAAPSPDTQPALVEATSRGSSDIGFITGNNVNVRSGFSTAYYPVVQLNRGDKIQIVGEESGWLQIAPPKGTYSLIDKSFVDITDGGRSGTLNGRAWIQAGSALSKQKYARQLRLDKGAAVTILGETEDNAYYKIEPPVGAVLWITADFVDRSGKAPVGNATAGGPNAPDIETVRPGELNILADADPAGTGESDLPTLVPAGTARLKPDARNTSDTGTAAAEELGPGPVGLSATEKFRIQLNAIEAEITAENQKSIQTRDYSQIIARLQPIATQEEDETAKLYADARAKQLERYGERIAGLRQLLTERQDTMAESTRLMEERQQILDRIRTSRGFEDIVARGEIRVSSVFNGAGERVKLWRIVDPETNSTIAYMQLGPGSPIDPVHYYGKYIGIRSTARTVMKGTTPPLPIYTVREIVVLDPPGASGAGKTATAGGSDRVASPQPKAIAAPTSQPAPVN